MIICVIIATIALFLICITINLVHRAKIAIYKAKRDIEMVTDFTSMISKDVNDNPKTVSSRTDVLLIRINNDFPEFNWFEFRQKSNNMLISALQAISVGSVDTMIDASESLKKQTKLIIDSNNTNNVTEKYSDVVIHDTQIYDYKKDSGTCIITIQSAVGYNHMKSSDKPLVKEQVRYNIELLYVQDPLIVSENKKALAMNCPNCGASITSLGDRNCQFCGSTINPINLNVWSIDRFYLA